MGKRISVDQLAGEIQNILKEYNDDVSMGITRQTVAVAEKGAQAVNSSAAGAGFGGRKYKRSWYARTEALNRVHADVVICSREYRVAHLLEKSHPEVLERISRFPNNVKTAWEGRPHGVYQFRRQGPGFFALVKWGDSDQVEEVQVKDAIQGIACEWGTPRTDFTPEFWRYATPSPDGPKGIYDALKRYRPQMMPHAGSMSDETQAVQALEKCAPLFSAHLRRFARDVSDDIRSFGTLPRYTISRIAHAGNAQTPEETAEAVQAILLDIESIRGANYLDAVRRAAESDSIVVTVEKN